MPKSAHSRIRYTITTAVALLPWLAAMYLFYWLNSSGTWTSDTPHRGKMSVILLGGGMLLTFLLQSHFTRRSNK